MLKIIWLSTISSIFCCALLGMDESPFDTLSAEVLVFIAKKCALQNHPLRATLYNKTTLPMAEAPPSLCIKNATKMLYDPHNKDRILFFGEASGALYLYNRTTKKILTSPEEKAHELDVKSAAFDPHNPDIIAYEAFGALRLWNIATNSVEYVDSSPLWAQLSYDPERKNIIAFGDWTNQVSIWNTDTQTRVSTKSFEAEITHLSHINPSVLAVGLLNGKTYLLDEHNHESITVVDNPQPQQELKAIAAVATNQEQVAIIYKHDNRCNLFNTATGKQIILSQKEKPHKRNTAICFHPERNEIAIAQVQPWGKSSYDIINLSNFASCTIPLNRTISSHPTAIAYNPHTPTELAVLMSSGTTHFFDTSTLEAIHDWFSKEIPLGSKELPDKTLININPADIKIIFDEINSAIENNTKIPVHRKSQRILEDCILPGLPASAQAIIKAHIQ